MNSFRRVLSGAFVAIRIASCVATIALHGGDALQIMSAQWSKAHLVWLASTAHS
jgi:hypothetical protein